MPPIRAAISEMEDQKIAAVSNLAIGGMILITGAGLLVVTQPGSAGRR